MISYKNIKDVDMGCYARKNKPPVSDTIYTFDIETTSLFRFEEEEIKKEGIFWRHWWDVFDYSRPKEYYQGIDMIAIPYIWQFSIEDTVYYGREFMDFEKVLKKISDPVVTKVIWIHNLAYEFGFLPNILQHYTIENMVARDVRKPISFHVKELNIIFRCSFMLTNLKLAKAAEEYTDVEKKKGLDYTAKIRTPLTTLTPEELEYCEYDCICLYKVIQYYKKRYNDHIALIPLTSTSEVRKALQKEVDFYYIKHMWELVPEPSKYLIYMQTFQGGYTHACCLNANRIFKQSIDGNIPGYDIASSYPYIMTCYPLPCSEFLLINEKQYHATKNNENYCFIMKIRLYDVDSRYYNHYLSTSKCYDREGVSFTRSREGSLIYDNGRIQSVDYLETWVTNYDLEIIQRNYSYSKIEYVQIYRARQRLLDKRIITFILKLYKNKTTMKGIAELLEVYQKSKGQINGLYGCSVTNALKNSTEYVNGEWQKKDFTMDFVKEVLQETATSFSTLFYYPQGVFVTSIARYCLFMRLIASEDGNEGHTFDRHVIYCDTDSIKFYGDFDYIFDEYNKTVLDRHKWVCSQIPELKPEDFAPVDRKGCARPIGVFEKEIDSYIEFCTLGAKKYAYRLEDGLHITVSGVSKDGAKALNDDITNFHDGFEFGYKAAGKLTHIYIDDMLKADITDQEGNTYHSDLKYGIVLQPTTYTLGISEVYEALIKEENEKKMRLKYKEQHERSKNEYKCT